MLSQPSLCRIPPSPCKHARHLLKFSNKFRNVSQLPCAEELEENFLRVIYVWLKTDMKKIACQTTLTQTILLASSYCLEG